MVNANTYAEVGEERAVRPSWSSCQCTGENRYWKAAKSYPFLWVHQLRHLPKTDLGWILQDLSKHGDCGAIHGHQCRSTFPWVLRRHLSLYLALSFEVIMRQLEDSFVESNVQFFSRRLFSKYKSSPVYLTDDAVNVRQVLWLLDCWMNIVWPISEHW